jgi:hypothetical protein
MNLTSSYSLFCYITKLMNVFLTKNNGNPIIFNDDEKHNNKELKRFFSIIDSYRHYIFLSKNTSPILTKLSELLKRTKCLGIRNEEITKKIIDSKLGENSCKLFKEDGLTKFMKNGIDCKILINNFEHTAQIKPYKFIVETDEVYNIVGSSSLQIYHNVDLYVFVNTKKKIVKIFKTRNSRIFNGNYLIPKENELLTLVGDKNFKLIDCNKYL